MKFFSNYSLCLFSNCFKRKPKKNDSPRFLNEHECNKGPGTSKRGFSEQSSSNLEVPQHILKKYNSKEIVRWDFDQSSLEELKDTYHTVHGLPKFMHDLLAERPSAHKMRWATCEKEMYALIGEENDTKVIVMPNPSHTPSDYLNDQGVMEAKNHAGGFGLVTWSIMPEQIMSEKIRKALEGDSFSKVVSSILSMSSEISHTSSHLDFLRKGSYEQQEKLKKLRRDSWSKVMVRSESQEEIFEIEDRTKQKIFASILDLDKNDLPLLKNMRVNLQNHLEEVYGIDSSYTVRAYFHFPYAESTVTLHLHVRVNQGLHPLEASRSFSLDEIIKGFEDGKTINQMILERGPIYTDMGTRVPLITDVAKHTVVNNILEIPGNDNGATYEPFEMKDKLTMNSRSSMTDISINKKQTIK